MADLSLTPLSDDELDALAEITDQDIVDAHERAAGDLDPRYRNLLVTEESADDAQSPA